MSFHTFKTLDIKCSLCRLKNVCIPTRLIESEFLQLEHVIKKRTVLKYGEVLINAGDEFDSIYAVSSGSFKNVFTSEDGTQQVTNFYLPAELIGLNAIGQEHHFSKTVALETSSVCRIKFSQLEEIMQTLPNIHREVLSLMSNEIRQEQCAIGIISSKNALEKVVSFVINISDRFHNNGVSGEVFSLTMSRAEIADYLGMATETVSRQFTELVDRGLLIVDGRNVEIPDKEKLVLLME